jgi:VCBS repeat-containing protein
VTALNDAPMADDDGPYTVGEGGTLNVSAAGGVLNGDTDVDSSTLTATLVTGPVHASSFTLNADGSFSYVHDGSETTSDAFTYRANDGTSVSNLVTVSITVTPVNDAPAHRPVLFLPGIGGNYTNNLKDERSWLLHRGVAPDQLEIDPLTGGYNPIIATLEKAGYV